MDLKGAYDASTKKITWSIGANYNGKTLEAPALVDILKIRPVLGSGFTKSLHYEYCKNGDPTKGAEVNPNKYTYSINSDNELKVIFTDKINSAFYIEFNTSLEGQIIGSTIENKANLYDGAKVVSKDLTASVKIPFGEDYVLKDGTQNGDKMDWSLQINRGSPQ